MTELERSYKRLYDKRWREKHREYRNAKARAYYAANRERILARRRESYRQKKEAQRDE